MNNNIIHIFINCKTFIFIIIVQNVAIYMFLDSIIYQVRWFQLLNTYSKIQVVWFMNVYYYQWSLIYYNYLHYIKRYEISKLLNNFISEYIPYIHFILIMEDIVCRINIIYILLYDTYLCLLMYTINNIIDILISILVYLGFPYPFLFLIFPLLLIQLSFYFDFVFLSTSSFLF